MTAVILSWCGGGQATDSAGNTQPSQIPWNFLGYANNGIHAIAVEVPEA